MQNGHIKRITDQDIQSSVLEIMSDNVATTYIVTPADPQKTLGIKLPFLVMIIKNLKKYFSFEVQVLDDKNVRRRFRASNYQVRATAGDEVGGAFGLSPARPAMLATPVSHTTIVTSVILRDQLSSPLNTLPVCQQSTTRVKPFICTMPMRLDDGWNQIQFNLSDFTRRAYGKSTLLLLWLWGWERKGSMNGKKFHA